MSFLVAEGHVQVDASTGDAERDIRQLATSMGALGPAARASAQGMRDLRSHTSSASTALTNLARRAAAAAAELNRLAARAREAERALAGLRDEATQAAAVLTALRASTSSANNSLRTLSTRADSTGQRMGDLSDRSRTLRRDIDDLGGSFGRAGDNLNTVRGTFGRVGSSAGGASGGMGALTKGALMLAPALIPIAAVGVQVAASMAAAGAGVAAFGAAVIPQIAQMAKAAEAETKYRDAVKEHGRYSAAAAEAAAEQQRVLRSLPPETQRAAAALSNLRAEFKSWSNDMAADTAPVITKGIGVLQAMLPRLTPMVRGTSGELARLMNVIGGAVVSPGFDRFMDRFAEFSTGALARATTGMVRFTQSMNTGQVGGNVREFMEYARANGPIVGETLGNLGRVLLKLLAAGSDVGVSILTVVNAFAELVNAVPTSVISNMLQLYAAMKLVQMGVAGVAAVAGSGALARLGVFFQLMGRAGVGATMGALAASMTRTQKAALGLGVLAVAAIGIGKLAEKARGAPPDVDRLATSLKNLATTGRFTGELKNTFGSVDGVITKLKQLGTERKKLTDAQGLGTGFRIPGLDDLADTISGAVQDMAKGGDSLNALKDDFKGLDSALAQMVSSGQAGAAADSFARIKDAARAQGVSMKELGAAFPQYKAAVANLKAEQQLAAAGMGLFGQQAIAAKSKLDAQKASADGLRQSIQALNDVQRAGLGGMIGFEQAIDAAGKAAKENAGALSMSHGELNLNSEKARTAATALQDLASKTDEATASARESGASWQRISGIYQRGRSSFVQAAQAMGLTKSEANQLADQLLKIPDKTSTKVQMQTEDAERGLSSVIAAINKTPNSKSVTVKALSDGAVMALEDLGFKVKRLPNGQFTVTARTGDVGAKLGAVKRLRDGLKDKTVTISAKAAAAIAGLDGVIKKMKATPGSKTVTVKALSGSAIAALEAVGFKVKRLPDGRISVTARTGSAQANIGAVQRARDRLSSKSITITTNRVTNVITNYVTSRKASKGATFGRGGSYWRASGGPVPGFADGGSTSIVRDVQMFPRGGFVTGPGSGTSDSIAAISMAGMPYRVSNTEYVIQADSVSKYGVPMLDAINEGRFVIPGFASGGSTATKEARKQLTSDVTFTSAGKMAGYKYTETIHDLGMPESVASLVTSVNTYLRNIKNAFSGKTEASLVRQLSSTGPTLFAHQRNLEAVNKQLEEAKSSLESVRGEFDNLRASVKSSLIGFANITKMGKWGTSPQVLIDQLRQDTSRTSQFAGQLEQLKARGLNAAILQDIAEAGVAGGGAATATSLLGASPAQIAEINRLQAQLTASADAAGKTTATAMYGAGVQAAEGLVAGLTAKQDQIEAAMMAIAKSMEKSIKKALGIKSPSTVMEQVGDFAQQGLAKGWTKPSTPASSLITSPTSSALRVQVTTPTAAAAPTAAPAACISVQELNVNVSGSFDFASPSERRAVARAMVRDINEELRAYQRERR